MEQEAQRATYRAPEYNVPSLLMGWRGQQYLVFRWAWKHIGDSFCKHFIFIGSVGAIVRKIYISKF